MAHMMRPVIRSAVVMSGAIVEKKRRRKGDGIQGRRVSHASSDRKEAAGMCKRGVNE